MPAAVPTTIPSGFFDYEFHQVAIYADDQDDAVEFYKEMGHNKWIEDNARLAGILDGHYVETEARMQFNYTIMPMELEFLTYTGPNRHAAEGRFGEVPFISHMSVYTDDVFDVVRRLERRGWLPYHRFVTQNHTNPGVIGKKRFIECIYDTRATLGYDVKFIQKVPWLFPDNMWLALNPELSRTYPGMAEKSIAFGQAPRLA